MLGGIPYVEIQARLESQVGFLYMVILQEKLTRSS
jgi:hypothetical protein